jgi:hypothetical protein
VTSAGTNTRIDIVVVELDPEANTIVTKIVSGEAVSADPVAPTLTQSATGIYQLPIATLTIPASTVAITTGMLVDTRTFMGNRVGIWTTATRPANPTAYQTLGYNTTTETHESWNGTAWVGFFDPISTEGDLVVGDGTGQASRLGVGDDDQVLTVVDGAPTWADAAGGGNYYNITAAGTYAVNLPAGYYDVDSIAAVVVGGVSVDGDLGRVNFPSGIDTLVTAGYSGWIQQTSGITDRFEGVAYGAGLFAAVYSDGRIRTSPDGITWTERTTPFGNSDILCIVFGDGLFVAGGIGGNLITSADGITWTYRTSGVGFNTIFGVAYGNGTYIAVAAYGDLSSSTNGTSWTTESSGTSSWLYAAGFGNGVFLAGGQSGRIISSTDGTNWTTRTSQFGGSDIRGLAYGAGVYVAAGYDGKLSSSTDGTNWTVRDGDIGTYRFQSVAYGDGLFVAGGDSGKMSTSPDGITWTERTAGFGTTRLQGFAYGDGLWVAVAEAGKIGTSPDGLPVDQFDVVKLFLEAKLPMIELS